MHRLALFAAAGIVIAAVSPAEAAARHKHKVRAPAAQSVPVMQAGFHEPSRLGRAAAVLYQ
jgi:hypothetical protein